MSRIGKKPIPVPSGVDVTINGNHVAVKGPKGSLELDAPEDITVTREGDDLLVGRPDDERQHRALHGLTRSLVNNMVVGVSDGFSRDLEIVGVGYRAIAQGQDRLELQVGYSHSVPVQAPGRHHVRGPGAEPDHGPGDRQAAGGPGCRRHPQGPQARALQGQGDSLLGRARAAQGRQVSEVDEDSDEPHQASRQKAPALPGAQEGPRHRRAAAPRRVPFQQAHLRSGDRRRRRPAPSRPPPPWSLDGAKGSAGSVAAAKAVGERIGERAKRAGVDSVVFDRGGFKYHGRVAAIADGARSAGLEF